MVNATRVIPHVEHTVPGANAYIYPNIEWHGEISSFRLHTFITKKGTQYWMFCDNIDIRKLIERAQELDFPVRILALSIMMRMAPRILKTHDHFQNVQHPF